eukprot:179953_1
MDQKIDLDGVSLTQIDTILDEIDENEKKIHEEYVNTDFKRNIIISKAKPQKSCFKSPSSTVDYSKFTVHFDGVNYEAKKKSMDHDSHQVWMEMRNLFVTGTDEDQIKDGILQALNTIKIDDTDEYGWSLAMLAGNFGHMEFVEKLVTLGCDINQKNIDGYDLLYYARKKKFYHIEEYSIVRALGGDQASQVKHVLHIMNKQNGITKIMMQKFDKKTLNNFVDIMCDIIRNKQIFSDDMLHVAFNANKNKVWSVLSRVCVSIISDTSRKRDWFWLKEYLLKSTIWYQKYDEMKENKDENDNYLFYKLLNITQKESDKQAKLGLKDKIKKLEQMDENNWLKLVNYNVDTIEYKNSDSIRQDMVKNGTVTEYTREFITNNCAATISFKPLHFYDINQYLPKLVLTSNMLDDNFQKCIKNMYKDCGLNVQYRRGPVKLLNRCQAKSECDYANKNFPTSAHVLDILRCALIFDSIHSMLKGMDLFCEKIKDDSLCVKEIVRVKNGFETYNHNDPKYTDIKFNVRIDGGKHGSIIGEVQFLFSAMAKYKLKAHSLYGIIRIEEFVSILKNLMPLKLNIMKQFNVCLITGNAKQFSNLIITNNLSGDDIINLNPDILYIVIKKRSIKILKLLKHIIPKKYWKLPDMKDGTVNDFPKRTPLMYALSYNSLTYLKIVLSVFENDKDSLCHQLFEYKDGSRSKQNAISYIVTYKLNDIFNFLCTKYSDIIQENKVICLLSFCIPTGLDLFKVLWNKTTNEEKLDVFNGIGFKSEIHVNDLWNYPVPLFLQLVSRNDNMFLKFLVNEAFKIDKNIFVKMKGLY